MRYRGWMMAGLALLLREAAAGGLPVMLDAGHTPAEPGALAPDGRGEHRYNHELLAALRAALAERNIAAQQTAAADEEITLAARTARMQPGQLLISLHHDSIPQAWIDAGQREAYAGFSLFISQTGAAPVASLACAQKLGARLLAAGEKPSLYHALPVPEENRPLLDAARGVHRYDALRVLRTAPGAAVLVEAGVIANPHEALRLREPETVRKLAQALAAGVADCLETAERQDDALQ